MADAGHLRNAPIQEALVDLRIAASEMDESEAHAALESLFSKLRSRYPVPLWQRKFEARVDSKPKAPHAEARDLGLHSLVLQDGARSRVVQFRLGGFTSSKLRGYTSGDDLFQEALQVWELYAAALSPVATIRVAVRYINRLVLPLHAGDDFAKFLTSSATMPPGTPQAVSEFLVRTVAHPDPDTIAVVTQRLEKGTEEGTPFVLDIDVFRPGRFSVAVADLEPILQQLRVIKNQMFFAFVTDEALEPYR